MSLILLLDENETVIPDAVSPTSITLQRIDFNLQANPRLNFSLECQSRVNYSLEANPRMNFNLEVI